MLQNINLAVHFLLELCMLGAVGYWGFKTGNSLGLKLVLGILIPLGMAVIWGTFRVPNDPGPATVAVPGWLRLVIELGSVAIAGLCLFAVHRPTLAWIFLALSLVNYALMYERLGRILLVK
jgi:hypothetical protein